MATPRFITAGEWEPDIINPATGLPYNRRGAFIDLGFLSFRDAIVKGRENTLIPYAAGRLISSVRYIPPITVPPETSFTFYFLTPNTGWVANGGYGFAKFDDSSSYDTLGIAGDGDGTNIYGGVGETAILDVGPLVFCLDIYSFASGTKNFMPLGTWEADTPYCGDAAILDPNDHIQYLSGASASGVSGSELPEFATDGGQTSDGTLTWTDAGLVPEGQIHVIVEVVEGVTHIPLYPATIEFIAPPVDVGVGQTMPDVTVIIRDQNGNPYTFASVSIYLSCLGDNNGNFGFETSTSADQSTGIATFSGISPSGAGTFVLRASTNPTLSAGPVFSDPFVVTDLSGATIEFDDQPVTSPQFATIPVSVILKDSMGDPILGTSLPVVVSMSGGTLNGHLTQYTNPATGIATFPDLWITEVDTGWVIVATMAGPDPVNSDAFDTTAFALSDITGLRLLLQADDIELSDGDPVGTWPDASGNDFDATSAGDDRPTFKTAIQNSLAVVRFGETTLMDVPAVIEGQPDTVFIVANKVSDDTYAILLAGGQETQGQTVIISDDAPPPGYLSISAGSNRAGSGDQSGAFHVFSIVFNGDSSKAWIDGTLNISADVGTTGGQTNAFGHGNFDYAQLVIYDTALSNENRNRAERLLATKWGI